MMLRKSLRFMLLQGILVGGHAAWDAPGVAVKTQYSSSQRSPCAPGPALPSANVTQEVLSSGKRGWPRIASSRDIWRIPGISPAGDARAQTGCGHIGGEGECRRSSERADKESENREGGAGNGGHLRGAGSVPSDFH